MACWEGPTRCLPGRIGSALPKQSPSQAHSPQAARPRLATVIIAALALVAVAAGVLYVFTGSVNGPVGADRATPGGTLQPGVPPTIEHIHGLAVDPSEEGALWVASHDGLFRFREPGSWVRVGDARLDLMGFSASPSEPGVFYTSGHPGPGTSLPNPVGLLVSRDGGRTWDSVSLAGEVDFHALAISPADGKLLYGWFGGELYRSEDGGRTWNRQPAPELAGSAGHGPLQLAAHPSDRDVLLAATEGGLLRSTDAGRSWDVLLPGLVTAVSYAPGTPERIYAYSLDTGLVMSPDGGRTWEPMNFSAGDEDAVSHVVPHPEEPNRFYLATFKARLFKSADGGATWQPLSE